MSSFQRELIAGGRLRDLPAIIEFVEECCADADVDPASQFDIMLAVEEASNNVIRHAYSSKGGELKIHIAAHGPDLYVTLYDRGHPFDPAAVERPDLTSPLGNRRIGGLGMHLIHQLMDDVHYAFEPEGNSLLMIKRGVINRRAEARDG